MPYPPRRRLPALGKRKEKSNNDRDPRSKYLFHRYKIEERGEQDSTTSLLNEKERESLAE